MRLIFVIFFFIVGCATKPSYHLEWGVNTKAPLSYRTTIAGSIQDSHIIKKNAFELETDKIALNEAINNLQAIPLNSKEMPLITTLAELNTADLLEIQMVVGKTEYTTPPKDEIEETKRKIESQSEGMIQLYTQTSSFGKNKSFFLKQVQKNLAAIFFELPQKPVRVGDSWSLPTNLIEIGNGFIPKSSDRVNKVWIRSAYEDQQFGTVLEIIYLIGERVSGNFVQTTRTKEATPAFELLFSYIAYGEFLPDTGQWKQYKGQMSAKGSGSLKMDSDILYALHPVN